MEMLFFSAWDLMVFLTLLPSSVAGEELFEVQLWPEWPVVEAGKALWINCSTNCTNPEKGGIETRDVNSIILEERTHWKVFNLSNISQNINIFCYFRCSGVQKWKSVKVIVYRPPEQMTLNLQPAQVAVGQNFTLTCHVPNVFPLENLTLILLQDTKELHSQTFETVPNTSQDAWLTLNITAQREDNNSNFSCQAKLDLRPLREQNFSLISSSKMIMIFEHPRSDDQILLAAFITVPLLLVFVISVCLCFAFGQHWHQHQTGMYRVLSAWRSQRII